MNKIIGMMIDLTEEAYNYQKNNKKNLIDEEQWFKWIELFNNDLPIVQEKGNQEEEESGTHTVFYDRDSANITEREENEMFNYVHYLRDWNKNMIASEVKGKQLSVVELLGDLIRKTMSNNIEDYEPTENEIDVLTIPKDSCSNIPFGELIETIVDMKYPEQGRNSPKAMNRFDYLPIKMAILGYPLSGHRTQAKLINDAYPNIKVYSLITILNEYMETYERLIKPIEDHPKYKPNKKGLVEQLQQEVTKEREQFSQKETIIKPYIEAKANDPSALPLDSVLLNLLIEKLNEDFPITASPTEALNELYSKITKKKEMIKKIEQLKQEEISTKKPKTKDIQLIQKDIDKLILELYFGFIIVDFPQTKKQCALIEHFFTGFVSEIDKPMTEKTKVLNSFCYSIDSQPHLPSLTKLERSGFDLVIDLSVSSNEIERRYKGLRYDPHTKAYYHLEDNPPKEGDKKVSERLIIPPEYANNNFSSMKEHYERNANEIRTFYSIFGVNRYKTKTYQVIQSERKQNEIFEEINTKLIETKMKQIEIEQIEAEAKQAEAELEPIPISTTNNQMSKFIQFQTPIPESPIAHVNNFNDTPLHLNYESEGRSEKRRTNQSLKEINFVGPFIKFSAFNIQYLNECKIFFWFLSSQKKSIISHVSNIQTKFIQFLSKPSRKEELASIYVKKFNSFLNEYGLYKENKKVRVEFSNDIQELNEKLWVMIQNRKTESIKYLEALKQSNYKQSQIEYLYDYTKQLIMIEAKKYLTSVTVLRQYYDSVHLIYPLHLYSPEDIFEGINNSDDFNKKIHRLYKNCIRLIYKQDEKIKELEAKIRQSQALNDTNVTSRKKRKLNIVTSLTHVIDKDFYFFEEEVKQILRTEKNKFKFRITMLKYFAMNYNTLINKLFDDLLNELDLWVILSIEAQNCVLNELMFHLNDRLKKGESAVLSFEFDSFDIYKPFEAREYFETNDYAIGDSDYVYNVKSLKLLYEDVKQYTIAPQIISKKVFIDVLVKRLLLAKKDSVVISKALGSISYHSYANLIKLIEIAIDHSAYATSPTEELEIIKEIPEEKKESIETKEFKENEAEVPEKEEHQEEEVLRKDNDNEQEIIPQYDTYLNLPQAFVVLALINSKLLGQKEERELREDLKGKIIKSTQITREAFCELDFWWETDDYLQIAKEAEPEKEAKILSLKNMLFDICKDGNTEEDEINIEQFINILSFKNANEDLAKIFQSEYTKDQDDRCTYLDFIAKI